MRWRMVLAACLLTSAPLNAGQGCAACHVEQAHQFAGTAMAKAALSDDFIKEWAEAGRGPDCLSCHAPSQGAGVGCTDCHGMGAHPFARLSIPETCARCHDAPGESTVRSHNASLSARRGLNCLSCHVKSPKESHVFLGATSADFLTKSARLHLALRKESGKQVLVVAVRPQTGHALPGGTTGRAVWLTVRGLDKANAMRWTEQRRFGWLKGPQGIWEDATLAPDIGVNLDLADPGRNGAVRIEAELIYRFRSGPLEEPDSRQVSLSRASMTLRP
ncbi:MAG: hypothetical protein HQL45_15320 [Alphaproteobacteria bacterium]|nr:hypothetical protein [Alphaproteobacteria bacterium]